MALVLAAWQLHGLQPGPLFLEDNADLAWALILGLLLSNIINSILTVIFSPVLSRVPGIDIRYVAPVVHKEVEIGRMSARRLSGPPLKRTVVLATAAQSSRSMAVEALVTAIRSVVKELVTRGKW